MTDADSVLPLKAPDQDGHRDPRAKAIIDQLNGRSLVLVGMMGAGKTSVGRRLAVALGLQFVDADHEIESAAGMTIPEIFARHGEPYFRDGERRVVTRLLSEGQRVVATGGGAFIQQATRDDIIKNGVSIWIKADVDVLIRRVRKRVNRPLLQTSDPETTMRRLIDERYPIYAQADFSVVSRDGPHENMVDKILGTLESGLAPLARLKIHHMTRPATSIGSETSMPAAQPANVHVTLGARSYEIFIGNGLIETAGQRIAKLFPGSSCAIVTDRNVAGQHLDAVRASLDAAFIRHSTVIVAPGEGSKSFAGFTTVCETIIAARMERGDLIIALGGGVVGDLAGFAAASIRRGMNFIQIPTTLLAQVDSSVGGKTGINSDHGKNLIGAFHQPALVLADTATLKTLSPRHFKAGYAEVAKYGLIDNLAFFKWLEDNWQVIFNHGPELIEAIAQSCQSKANVVARDETEQGDRALLNLGHTFGHALETLTHYDSARLIHGEGVAIGMMCALRLSHQLGHCGLEDVARVEQHLKAVGLPTRINQIHGLNAGADAILEAMYQDKKVQRGALTFILLRGIGQSFVAKNVPAEAVRSYLERELTEI